jgi:hypothetical protein
LSSSWAINRYTFFQYRSFLACNSGRDWTSLLAQRAEGFKEINLRLSIARQDIYWRIRAADDYAHDFQRLSSKPVTEETLLFRNESFIRILHVRVIRIGVFFYAAYFVGNSTVDPTKITPGTVRGRFDRFQLVSFFKEHFSNDPFTNSLVMFIGVHGKAKKIAPDKDHQTIRDIRDAISHKATPGRIMRVLSSAPHIWLLSELISRATDQALGKDFLLNRQDWLESAIRRFCTELGDSGRAQ